jgi:hypothetical protein
LFIAFAKDPLEVSGTTRFFAMRRAIAVLGFSAVLVSGAAFLTLLPEDTRAAGGQAVFQVSANDGYGVGDCLVTGEACGQIVADSWCQTQGFARAISYTAVRPEDATGSVLKVAAADRNSPISITCAR